MISMVLPDKDKYTLVELLNNLPISLRELGRRSEVNKVTIYGIMRKGRIPHSSTVNKLLGAMSAPDVYGRPLSWDNVIVEGEEEEKSADE